MHAVILFIVYLEKVLMHENQSLDFKGQLENINTMVETDYGGASTYKDIQLLVGTIYSNKFLTADLLILQRMAGSHLDQDGSFLFLLERELPAKTNGPFILVIELPSG